MFAYEILVFRRDFQWKYKCPESESELFTSDMSKWQSFTEQNLYMLSDEIQRFLNEINSESNKSEDIIFITFTVS